MNRDEIVIAKSVRRPPTDGSFILRDFADPMVERTVVTYISRRKALALFSVGLAATLALTACGGDDNGSTTSPSAGGSASFDPSSVSKDANLAAMVPASIASDGTLSFGTDASYAPSEFFAADGTTIVGFDVDLGMAIAARLGLKGQFQNANFDSIITGVNSGKYDVGMSSFTITADRETQANMISYFNAGTSWAVPAGNPDSITPDTACGHIVAVQKATVQVDDLNSRSKKCTDAGNKPIQIQQYVQQSDATTAVVGGKADAMLADSPVVAYAIAQTNGALETSGDIYASAPYGIVVPKDATDLAKAIQGAVQSLMDDGSYQKILDTWGVGDGAITKSEINPAAS
jgi:polar amino acid transport system substrate-binding protein